MFYDVVFFKPQNVTVRLLPDGTYNVIKPPGFTIQAINGRPPVDQSAEVAALMADLAACLGVSGGNMADFASALQKGIDALDELCVWQGQPTITTQIAGAGGITQAQYDAVVAERDARQAAILVVRANANARKAADATSVDGQADLDAIAAF